MKDNKSIKVPAYCPCCDNKLIYSSGEMMADDTILKILLFVLKI